MRLFLSCLLLLSLADAAASEGWPTSSDTRQAACRREARGIIVTTPDARGVPRDEVRLDAYHKCMGRKPVIPRRNDSR